VPCQTALNVLVGVLKPMGHSGYVVRVRIGMLGTRHGHAAGKWRALCTNPNVEAVGIYDPDPAPREGFPSAKWLASADDLLTDPSVVAVAVEARNHQSLPLAAAAIDAGKHLWFDKPAGDDWPAFQKLMRCAAERNVHVQMGYMFRYSPGFARIASMARSGALGTIFEIRAHMSTNVDLAERREQSRHLGGIMYDLGGHMLDQIVWLLGRPGRICTAFQNVATPSLPSYVDNAVAVLEFDQAVAVIDIAAMEPRPTARRFEVFGTEGSAILEPFDPVRAIRFASNDAARVEELEPVERQSLYERELDAFLAVLRGERAPDRRPEHDLLAQETLLRVTGRLTS
jgi:predicted dehydrogenase